MRIPAKLLYFLHRFYWLFVLLETWYIVVNYRAMQLGRLVLKGTKVQVDDLSFWANQLSFQWIWFLCFTLFLSLLLLIRSIAFKKQLILLWLLNGFRIFFWIGWYTSTPLFFNKVVIGLNVLIIYILLRSELRSAI